MAQNTIGADDGWAAVGYSLAGGFEKDIAEREKIQALDAAKANLQWDQESGKYNPMPGSELDMVKTQNQMLQQQLAEVQKTVTTDKQWNTIVDSVQTNNFDSFNKLMNEDPNLNKIFKQNEGIHAVRQFDPTNPSHINAMQKGGFNPQVLEHIKAGNATPEEITQIGNAYPVIEKQDGSFQATSLEDFLAKTNLLKSATRTTESKTVLDAIAMGKQAITGVTDAAYKSSLQSSQAKSTLEASTAKKGIQGNEIMMKAMSTGSAEEVLKAFQITNPELYLKTTRGSDSKRDSLQQYMEALDLASVPKEERPGYVEKWIQKTTEGVGAVSKEKDITQLGGAQKTATELFSPTASSIPPKEWATKAQETENNLLYNLPPAQAEAVAKVKTKLESTNATATLAEKLLKGPAQKVSRGAIDEATQWVEAKLGIETKQALANVDFNTRSGMLVAGFLKEMSGTAVADQEVQRNLVTMLSGNLNDETYVRTALKSFAQSLRDKNNLDAKPYMNTLPATIGRTTNLKPKYNDGQRSVGGNKPISNDSLPPLIFPGKGSTSTGGFPTIKSKPQQGGKPPLDSFWR
jgi:hypothetical protein